MFDAKAKAADEPLDCAAGGAPQALSAPAPVLVVLHQTHSSPGHIGRLLRQRGHALDIRRPRYGDSLPTTLAQHAGAVIFGGPMSANDNDDYILRETAWIGVALKEGKPFLGVCLGAQMLARHLGARVFLDPEQRVEIGYHAIEPNAEARKLGEWPERVYQWHKEGFDLPAGATLLATSSSPFPNQAFRIGSALAVQFHPEISCAQVCRWTGYNPGRLTLDGAQARHDQIASHVAYAPRVHAWLAAMLDRWVDGTLDHGMRHRVDAVAAA